MLIKTGAFLPHRIVPPNVCVENCQNKNSIISYLRRYLLSPLSSVKQFYAKFLKLKSTDKDMQNVIYKIKSYFPQPVQGARHTTLLYFYEN